MSMRAKIALVVAALFAPVAVPAADAATTRSCGSVYVTVAGKTSGGRVDALRVPCARARLVIRYALAHPYEFGVDAPPGWKCVRDQAAPEFSRALLTCTRRANRARVRLLRPQS